MINFKITTISESDIQHFRKALDSVAREKHYLAFLEAPPLEAVREFVLRNINQEWPHLIAICDNRVVGWADVTPLDRVVFSHIGTLGMGIIADFRGQGIGKVLLHQVLEKANEKGLTRIELTVRENNTPAIELYKKFGFSIEGRHLNAIKIDNHYENHLSMALIKK